MQSIDIKTIKLFFVIVVSMIISVYIGNNIADGQITNSVAIICLPVLLLIIFTLKERLYLIMIVCWGLSGKISIIPIPFNIRELVIIGSVFLYIIKYILNHSKEIRTKINMADFFVYINMAYIVTVFLRNPIGFAFMSGDRVGGKPYIETLLSFFGFIILKDLKITNKEASLIPKLLLLVSLFNTTAGAIGTLFPSIGNTIGKFYSVFYPVGMEMEASESQIYQLAIDGISRFSFLVSFGSTLILYIVSKVNPTRLLVIGNMRYLSAYILGIVMILMSGFRGLLVGAVINTITSILVVEKFIGFLKVIIILLVVLFIGIFISFTGIELPFAAQRAISFIPGNWNKDAVADAETSSDWRFQMWDTVLLSNKYIHNKVFGDGFGYLRADLERSISLMQGYDKLRENEMQQEMFMINGDFHSGPLTTIRCVGIVGLLLFIAMIIYLSFYSYKILCKCSKTPLKIYAYFTIIPIMLFPIQFIIIFGDYKYDYSAYIFSIGVLSMINNSINDTTNSKTNLNTEKVIL